MHSFLASVDAVDYLNVSPVHLVNVMNKFLHQLTLVYWTNKFLAFYHVLSFVKYMVHMSQYRCIELILIVE